MSNAVRELAKGKEFMLGNRGEPPRKRFDEPGGYSRLGGWQKARRGETR